MDLFNTKKINEIKTDFNNILDYKDAIKNDTDEDSDNLIPVEKNNNYLYNSNNIRSGNSTKKNIKIIEDENNDDDKSIKFQKLKKNNLNLEAKYFMKELHNKTHFKGVISLSNHLKDFSIYKFKFFKKNILDTTKKPNNYNKTTFNLMNNR